MWGKNNSPVVTFPVQQRFGVAIHAGLGVVSQHAVLVLLQRHEEGGLLNAVQGASVDSAAEVLRSRFGPGGSGVRRVGLEGRRGRKAE